MSIPLVRRPATRGWSVAAAALAFAVGTAAAQQADRFTVSGDHVAVYNIAGEVQLTAGSGSDVVVQVTRGGPDGDALSVEVGPIRGRETLRVIYPDDDRIVYDVGRGRFSTDLRVRDDGTWGDGRGGHRVRVSSRGSGTEAYANLEIAVPPGQRLTLYLAVGEVTATNIEGTLVLDTHSARVSADRITGSLVVDVGSGSVDVSNMEGDLEIDTGSGHVTVDAVRGNELLIDTGSGGVDGSDITVDMLNVDTGSGSIELTNVSAPRLNLDTGSGSVRVALTSDIENLRIDTGSGSVTVRIPDDLGASIEIDTGSGGIDFDDIEVQVRQLERSYFRGQIGDGRGRIFIDTGSGGVRLMRGR